MSDIARAVLAMIRKLKRSPAPLQATTWYEFFQIDPDFDVVVQVSLRAKKSQEQIGRAMFEEGPAG